jgi:guanyl-specific ribonuclease Sa
MDITYLESVCNACNLRINFATATKENIVIYLLGMVYPHLHEDLPPDFAEMPQPVEHKIKPPVQQVVSTQPETPVRSRKSRREASNNKLAKVKEEESVALPEPVSESVTEIIQNGSKPEIKKGITFDEIFQAYFLPELKDWCKQHGLKVTGNRRDIIKRILMFLDGDVVSTTPGSSKKRKRKGTQKKVAKRKVDQGAEAENHDSHSDEEEDHDA